MNETTDRLDRADLRASGLSALHKAMQSEDAEFAAEVEATNSPGAKRIEALERELASANAEITRLHGIEATCHTLGRELFEAKAERDAMRVRLETTETEYHRARGTVDALMQRVAKAEVERDAALAALAEFGEHQGLCPKKYHGLKDSRPCTCGLDALLNPKP